jgi:hypothetical protein
LNAERAPQLKASVGSLPLSRNWPITTMAIYDDQWFEIWYSEGGGEITPVYLLIVTPNPRKPNRIQIIDPFEKNKVVFEGSDYEAATSWLCEDEYTLADGRQFPDDGWPLQTGNTLST